MEDNSEAKPLAQIERHSYVKWAGSRDKIFSPSGRGRTFFLTSLFIERIDSFGEPCLPQSRTHNRFRMRLTRKFRYFLLCLILYLGCCLTAGIFVADGTLHPARRPLTPEASTTMRDIAHRLDSDLADVSIRTPDGATLRAWTIQPRHAHGDAVILLHGLADNRIGMTGYAQLFLARGFTVLLPDARAHGSSGGELATYGLLERNDIQQWFDFLLAQDHPHCIFGFGESMGAAELLQSSLPSRTSALWPPNLRSPAFARLPTIAWVNLFISVLGLDALFFARLSNSPFSMHAGGTGLTCSKSPQKMPSPRLGYRSF
jgi:Serine aminopeptidase, S33